MRGKLSTSHMDVEPIPVVDVTETIPDTAAEFGSTTTFPVTTAVPIQVLQRRPTRTKAVVIVNPLVANTASAEGSVAAPAAQTPIVTSPVVPAGLYQISWTVQLEGTVAVGVDSNNFVLRANSAAFVNSVNPGVDGVYPQQPQTILLTSAGTVVIRNIGAATAGSTYSAQLTLTPLSNGVVFASRLDFLANPANLQGFQVNAPGRFDWESQQPLYAISVGYTTIQVGVIDQALPAVNVETEEKEESAGWNDIQEGGDEYRPEAGNRY